MLIIAFTFLIAMVVIIGVDIYLAFTKGFPATLSWWMYTASIKYPIIPAMIGFLVGLLFGHLFWDQELNVTVPCPTT